MLCENGLMLQSLNGDLGSYPPFILAAVKQNGLALQYVPEKLRRLNYVLTAVSQNGMALQYTPDDLKKRYIVLIAVRGNGLSLQYAPGD